MTRSRYDLDYESEERDEQPRSIPNGPTTFKTPGIVPRRQPVDQKALVRRDDGTFTYKRFTITATQLVVPDDVTQAEWREIGEVLGGLESAITWALADWAMAAAHRLDDWWSEGGDYESRYQALIEDTGYAYQTMRDYKWVADRFPPSIRNRHASFSHHRLVAPLYESPELQQAWLIYTEQFGLKVEGLKREMALVGRRSYSEQFDCIERALSQPCLISQLPEFKRPAPSAASPLADRINRQVFNRVWKGLEQGGEIKREDVQHLRRWVEALEEGLG